MPHDVLQTLKKQCNPLLKKSFKERNPDVDMDEIQNNPNVPEDVKAAITGALSLTLEEDEAEGVETCDEGLPAVEDTLETFDDDYIMMSDDDGKSNRRRRVDENDEDWLTGRRKGGKPRKAKRKHKKKRSKNRSEDVGDDKVKKKRSRKSVDTNSSLNTSMENSTLNSSTLNSTLNNTNTSFSGCENFSQNSTMMTNGMCNSSYDDSMRKENRPKKAPKKRDSTEKPVNGIVKKTIRRQITSLSAIMACIEAVVQQGNDAASPDTSSDIAVKTEPIEAQTDSFRSPPPPPPPNIISPMRTVKHEPNKMEAIDVKIKTEPKKKPRRKSTTAKAKDVSQLAANLGDSMINRSITVASGSVTKKSVANGTSAKQSKTSMKKVKFLS